MAALAARGECRRGAPAYEDCGCGCATSSARRPGPATGAPRRLLGRPPGRRRSVARGAQARHRPRRGWRRRRWIRRTCARRTRAAQRTVVERFGGRLGDGAAVFGVPVTHEDDAERAVSAALRPCRPRARRRAPASPPARRSSRGGAGPARSRPRPGELQRAARAGCRWPTRPRSTPRAGGRLRGRGAGASARAAAAAAGAAPSSGARTSCAARGPIRRGRGGAPPAARHGRRRGRRRQDPPARRAVGALTWRGVYRGRCLPYGEGITYWALREILWEAAGSSSTTGAAARRRSSARWSSALVGDEVERVTAAAGAPRRHRAARRPARAERRRSRSRRRSVWRGRASLGALAARRPLVVVEDLHWAEPPLLDMLEGLVSRCRGPLLLVATARPELAERAARLELRRDVESGSSR